MDSTQVTLSDTAEAMRLAVVADSECIATRWAYQDCLMEHGATPSRAALLVTEAVYAGRAAFAWALLEGHGVGATTLRAHCRALARARIGHPTPVVVDCRHGAPRLRGRMHHWVYVRNGDRCTHPESARRLGLAIRYVPSTERVLVGATWLLRFCAADLTPIHPRASRPAILHTLPRDGEHGQELGQE